MSKLKLEVKRSWGAEGVSLEAHRAIPSLGHNPLSKSGQCLLSFSFASCVSNWVSESESESASLESSVRIKGFLSLLSPWGWALFFFLFSIAFAPHSHGLESSVKTYFEKPFGRFAKVDINGAVVFDTLELQTFYSVNRFEPLWIMEGQLTGRLQLARRALLRASEHGLDADLYWRPAFDEFIKGESKLSELDFELGVSEALIRLARHIYRGQVEPSLLDGDIDLKPKPFGANLIKRLADVVIQAPLEIENVFKEFEPSLALYSKLKRYLRDHKNELSQKEFNKMTLSLEKLRWLPTSLGERYAFVNLASSEMMVLENEKEVIRMGVVNGRPTRRTPMMGDMVKTIELNPAWTVPLNLVLWDKLDKIIKDPEILTRNDFVVYDQSMTQVISDVTSIDWNTLSRDYFPYVIQQKPGPENALGVVKFPLTNKHHVYLHDSNERELFEESGPRLFSSGCIRLQKPIDFAAYLLSHQEVPKSTSWALARSGAETESPYFSKAILENYIKQSHEQKSFVKTTVLTISNPLPLYTVFLTADFDQQGRIRFSKDEYRQDSRLMDILVNSGGQGRLDSKSVRLDPSEQTVPFLLQGELGPTQLFGEGTLVRCEVKTFKGCVTKVVGSKEEREEFRVKLNKVTLVPEGYYLLGFENSRYPGWLHLQCKYTNDGACIGHVLSLQRLSIPENFRSAATVVVMRDLSETIEQNKFLWDQFHNGQSLLKAASYGPWGFYLAGVNQFDLVQRINNDFCFFIDEKEYKDIAPEVRRYCQKLRSSLTLEEFKNIPVPSGAINLEGTSDQINSMSSLSLFDFKLKTTPSSPLGQWTQSWITWPGAWFEFGQKPYLVASPMFPVNIPSNQLFVSVLPGAYKVLALDAKGVLLQERKFIVEE